MDLTFIDEGNPDIIDGLINFAKRRMIYNVINENESYTGGEVRCHSLVGCRRVYA